MDFCYRDSTDSKLRARAREELSLPMVRLRATMMPAPRQRRGAARVDSAGRCLPGQPPIGWATAPTTGADRLTNV